MIDNNPRLALEENQRRLQLGRNFVREVMRHYPATSEIVQCLWDGHGQDNDHYHLGVMYELEEQKVPRPPLPPHKRRTKFWLWLEKFAARQAHKSRS